MLSSNIFNSKLFINLSEDFSCSDENSISSENESYINIEDDINNKGCFLIKELIDEIDSPIIFENTKKNIINNQIILSLVNTGYEYIPKKYQQKKIDNKRNNIIKKGKNFIKEKKGDWICQFCSNVNFAFRTICNRCGGKKEICLQKIIM